MEIKFRQKGIGWCVVYTWANLLNDPGVLRLCDDELFKGCTEEDENELLKTYCSSVKNKALAYVNPAFGYELPIDLIWDIITLKDNESIFEEQAIIHTLSIRLIESIWHHTATVTYEDDIYYLDPLKEKWIKIIDKEHLKSMFMDCCQVSRPVYLETDSFASFNASYFQYPFLKSQQQTI